MKQRTMVKVHLPTREEKASIRIGASDVEQGKPTPIASDREPTFEQITPPFPIMW
ncbi:hypothetical protein KIN20_021209 [Parelaphostrongylus tenuis]|uniref:Uncharacterized protein n=1 Tax=Parelaphostrongylus tenuis TaxID=148309 RepID=A0AAD5N417_PARTN|nr:hypothetical protein KIN20_021209 [Parelaphostrongylus tenuis]